MLFKEQYEIIEQLVKNKIPVKLKWWEDRVCYELEGFSKSGTVLLYPCKFEAGENTDMPYFTCEQRYDKQDEIFSLQDIVFVNYKWWLDYKDRDPFQNPDHRWVPLLINFGYIKEEVETKKIYKPIGK